MRGFIITWTRGGGPLMVRNAWNNWGLASDKTLVPKLYSAARFAKISIPHHDTPVPYTDECCQVREVTITFYRAPWWRRFFKERK